MSGSKKPSLSLIVVAYDTKEVFFRDCMDSIVSQKYSNWELFVIDDNKTGNLSTIVQEFFPNDVRVHYRKLKNHKGKAYATNIGFHFASGDYCLLIDGHDRLDENALTSLADAISSNESSQVFYSDSDELEGLERVRPQFKQDFNKELLLHCDYIGGFICVDRSLLRQVGNFREALRNTYIYDFLLRCVEQEVDFCHIPHLLYHKRVSFDDVAVLENHIEGESISEEGFTTEVEIQPGLVENFLHSLKIMLPSSNTYKITRKYDKGTYKEYLTVVKAYLMRNHIEAEVVEDSSYEFWKIKYNGSDSVRKSRDYILLKDSNVKVRTKDSVERMYGILKQEDVAVVGARFMKNGLIVSNCGYIFDKDGMSYPAFYNTRTFDKGYNNLGVLMRDISMVDASYCMIDRKVYRRLGGFDPKLKGREAMLDFCLRAKAIGYRTVIDPMILVRKSAGEEESTKESFEYLIEKDKALLEKGDPFYNQVMQMGLENHII